MTWGLEDERLFPLQIGDVHIFRVDVYLPEGSSFL